MDPLTKRLMVESGLRPGNPTLPPVQGMRMVYLKEDMTDAEDDLHKARLALQKYEKNSSVQNKQNLYTAMRHLQAKEQDYFGSRYIGRKHPGVLKGWHNEEKQALLKKKIQELKTEAGDQVRNIGGIGSKPLDSNYDWSASRAAFAFDQACQVLQKMDDDWYNGPTRLDADKKPDTISKGLVNIKSHVQSIRRELSIALALTSPTREASLVQIRKSLRGAEICERIAILIDSNRWDLPMDLR